MTLKLVRVNRKQQQLFGAGFLHLSVFTKLGYGCGEQAIA